MTDQTKPTSETPIERALRLKKAALDARQHPSGSTLRPGQNKAMASGASKPAMRK